MCIWLKKCCSQNNIIMLSKYNVGKRNTAISMTLITVRWKWILTQCEVYGKNNLGKGRQGRKSEIASIRRTDGETKDDRRLDERRETQRQGTIDAKIRDDGRRDKRRWTQRQETMDAETRDDGRRDKRRQTQEQRTKDAETRDDRGE